MKLYRIWTMFLARNREFFRDRAAFGWNFLFPFLLVAGFAIIFGGEQTREYTVGVFPVSDPLPAVESIDIPEEFGKLKYAGFVGFEDGQQAFERLKLHKLDMVLQTGGPPFRYWINESSPRGYILEKVLHGTLMPEDLMDLARKGAVRGYTPRYIDWFFPGILAMNMMFSALWGVGYVVVRYRKNGVLKRLKATPLTAFEYLSAQMVSRIFLLMFTLMIVWFGCDLVFSFQNQGNTMDIFLVFFIGSLSLTSLGLVIAARGISEEFATGLLNFITWPMMFLSEVWFSLEGAPQWVQAVAHAFPLTHLLKAVRKIMNEGAGLADVGPEMLILALMATVFLSAGAYLFRWNE